MSSLAAAAFGDSPDRAVTALPDDPRERWLAAVVLGAQGWYARAAALLDELTRQEDPVLAALAAATMASHRRQLGGHAHARTYDAAGLARLSECPEGPLQDVECPEGPLQDAECPEGPLHGIGAGAARSDVVLGLAADAIGLGRLGEARRLVAVAPGDVGWRAAVRTGWVSAEIELSAGRGEAAVHHAEPAAERAGASGSVRHRIKSALVLGVALATDGQRERAGRMVSAAFGDATDLGLLTLAWPAAMILAELESTQADHFRRCAAVGLHSVLRRADPVGRRLAGRSPWVPRLAGPTG